MRARKRLRVIADLVEVKDGTVADVGADHGFLSKLLIDEARAKKVIATDISAPSLQKTKDLIRQNSLESKIECRVGDGLKPLAKGEVDLAIIAGMGGYEIVKILQESTALEIESFILQPVQNTVRLREYLNSGNYVIKKDFLICDKCKYYNTIYVVRGECLPKLTDNEIEFGKDNISLPSEDFKKYLISYIKTCEDICNKSINNVEYINKCKNAKNLYKQLYNSNLGEE